MATNLAIEAGLLLEMQMIGELKTKKATVNQVLKEFIQYRKQCNALRIFGTIDIDPAYDHKKGRMCR